MSPTKKVYSFFGRGRSEIDMKREANQTNGHQSPKAAPVKAAVAALLVALAMMLSPVMANAQSPAPATPAIRLQAVHAVTFRDNGRNAVTLALDLAGDYTYTPGNSGTRLLTIDLPGAVTDEDSASHLLASQLVSSYRVAPVEIGGHPMLRMEVLLKAPATAEYRRTERGLEMRLMAATASSGPAATPAAPAIASAPAAATPKMMNVSETQVSSRPANRLEKVQLSGSSESPSVQVTANGSVEFKAFELRAPHRLVVDMAGVVNHAGKEPVVVKESSPLRAVRVGQFRENPPTARVVLELNDDAKYDVHRGPNGVEIEVRSASAPATSAPAATPAKTSAATYSASLAPAPTTTAAPVLPAASSAVMANIQQASAAPKDEPASPEPMLVPRPNRTPVEENIAPAPVTPSAIVPGIPMAIATPSPAAPAPIAPAPPTTAETKPISMATAAAMLRTGQAMPSAQQATPPMSGGQVMLGPGAPPPPAGTKRYTGELISINVKDADLRDFFRLIQEISGLNVIIDQAVHGQLTMTLNDVPWDQALDIVLHNFQLDAVLDGNVLRIATADQVRTEQKVIADAAAAQQETIERQTVTRTLSYAKAAELMPTVRKFLTKRGDVVAYDRNNQLIITDTPAGIATVDNILAQLDKRNQQVEIEARVVAASRQFTRDFGSQIGYAFGSGNSILGGNPLGGNTSPISRTPAPVFTAGGGNSLPLFSNFPAPGANTGVAYTLFNPRFDLDLILTAAEQKGTGKLLSRPKIITQNNRQGKISQGVKIPIQTTVNNTISLLFQDVTLSMTVTPQITADGTIFMDIDVSNSTIDPGIPRINGTPALDTQEATTSVTVQDGGTVVFGGVVQNSNNLSVQQVPLLGSIPIVGNLFKTTSVSTTTTELIFFVTPKIL